MSKEYINQITLDCLLNKEQFSSHVNNKIKKSICKRDKKFYRKRVYDLTKILLLNKDKPENLLPDVKYAFDNYLMTCINYFKSIDNNDIIQNEYKDLEYIINDNFEDLDDCNLDEANKIMLRSIKLKPTLDNFITKIPKKSDEIILPKKKEIKLDDPNLKTKGIKKKNITNKYDEKKESKEEPKQEFKEEPKEEPKEEDSTKNKKN